MKIKNVGAVMIRPTPREEASVRCGFCSTGTHRLCPRATRGMGPVKTAKVWPCKCDDPDCGGGSILRCLDCKTETQGEVNPQTWMCYDGDICTARITARLDANPAVQLMINAKEKSMARATQLKGATKTAEPKAKPVKEATYCLVTGEPTSGGLFKPGMDARYVSELVSAVVEKATTVVEARKKLSSDGVSDALKAKFEKALALKREKAQKAKAEGAAPAAKKAAAAPARKETAAQKRKREAAEAAAAEAEDETEDDEDEAEDDSDF